MGLILNAIWNACPEECKSKWTEKEHHYKSTRSRLKETLELAAGIMEIAK
jgi:hypothetical protein